MSYILIIVLLVSGNHGGNVIDHIEFKSKEACETTIAVLLTSDEYFKYKAVLKCVPNR